MAGLSHLKRVGPIIVILSGLSRHWVLFIHANEGTTSASAISLSATRCLHRDVRKRLHALDRDPSLTTILAVLGDDLALPAKKRTKTAKGRSRMCEAIRFITTTHYSVANFLFLGFILEQPHPLRMTLYCLDCSKCDSPASNRWTDSV